MRLHFKNARCFRDSGVTELAPLTVLVGENSSGKSSFLALTRITMELVQGDFTPNFNREPFFLGAYDQIANYRGGRGGRSPSFQLCFEGNLAPDEKDEPSLFPPNKQEGLSARAMFEFKKRGSQPSLNGLEFSCGAYGLELGISDKEIQLQVRTPGWSGKVPLTDAGVFTFLRRGKLFDLQFLSYYLLELSRRKDLDFGGVAIKRSDALTLANLWDRMNRAWRFEPYAMSPVRSKPARTYNPVDDTPAPEGTHVPMQLAKMRFTDKRKWESVKLALETFGAASGLFQNITVKTLGRSDSDPFQILVKIAGPLSNLIDVGYGVSQILPIIVDLASGGRRRLYLMQQPEVHLHPRGQAALATFLGEFVTKQQSRVIVETHSDYLIDRLRMDIRDKKNLSPKDVAILFFERKKANVKIHRISIDENGNLVGQPRSYRSFFMAESDRLLGA